MSDSPVSLPVQVGPVDTLIVNTPAVASTALLPNGALVAEAEAAVKTAAFLVGDAQDALLVFHYNSEIAALFDVKDFGDVMKAALDAANLAFDAANIALDAAEAALDAAKAARNTTDAARNTTDAALDAACDAIGTAEIARNTMNVALVAVKDVHNAINAAPGSAETAVREALPEPLGDALEALPEPLGNAPDTAPEDSFHPP